jgi:hypothetical protein
MAFDGDTARHAIAGAPFGWRYSLHAAAANEDEEAPWTWTLQWYLRLMQDRTGFVAVVVERWRHLRATSLSDAAVASLVCRWRREMGAAAVARDRAAWGLQREHWAGEAGGETESTYDEQVAWLLGWTHARLAWMDANINTVRSALGGRGAACTCDVGDDVTIAACLRAYVTPYAHSPFSIIISGAKTMLLKYSEARVEELGWRQRDGRLQSSYRMGVCFTAWAHPKSGALHASSMSTHHRMHRP